MRKLIPVVLALVAGAALAVPEPARQEWPARAPELEAIRSLQREAQEIAEAQKRLEARAQAVFDDAAERRGVAAEARKRFRFDPRAGAFYLEPEAAPISSAIAPVSSR